MRTDIETLKIFLAAAETLSFRRTATQCQVSPQVVTRAIQALEERLGELLFHRSTRGVRLSDFGAVFKERANRAVEHMDGLFASSAASRPSKIAGVVRVAAPTMHGRRFVLPVLADLTRRHPGLYFDLRLSDEVVDPVKERIDVGVRGGRVSNSRLVVRTVAPVPNIICASPRLVAVLGSINSVQQLETAPTTQLIDRSSGRPWPWELAGGREFVPRNAAFCTDDPIAECMAVLEGLGIGQLSAAVADMHLASGKLVELLPETKSKPWALTVYRVRRNPVVPRVQATFRAMVQALATPSVS